MTDPLKIGLFHPQLMNRIAISYLLNRNLSDRVNHVEHLFDLFSAKYQIVILIEPEIQSVKYNSILIDSFINCVSKPIIVVPFYESNIGTVPKNVRFTKVNPDILELTTQIHEIDAYNAKYYPT